MAARTDKRFTRDLMLDAVPYSFASMEAAWEIWERGGLGSTEKRLEDASEALG